MKESIEGKEIGALHFIHRIHSLECIIFDLKNVLKYYADDYTYYGMGGGHGYTDAAIQNDFGKKAKNILEKHKKTWTELYDEVDKETDDLLLKK